MRTDEALIVHDAAHRIARSRRWGLPGDIAEEIAQETVARFAALPDGSIDDPAAWANRVAGNLCADYHRRRAPIDDEADVEGDPADALSRFLAAGVPTSLAAMRRQQAAALLAQLSPKERTLVQLVADGVPHSEIAEQLGYANSASVKSTLNRLRRKIEAQVEAGVLDADWQDHPRPY